MVGLGGLVNLKLISWVGKGKIQSTSSFNHLLINHHKMHKNSIKVTLQAKLILLIGSQVSFSSVLTGPIKKVRIEVLGIKDLISDIRICIVNR